MAEKIKKAASEVYGIGAANAAQVYKGTDYDGVNTQTGWFIKLFNSVPTFLGRSVKSALETLEDIAESRRADL